MKSLSFKLLKLCRTKLSKVTVPRPRAKCAWKATPLWLGGGLQWGHAERGVSARQITVRVRACVRGWVDISNIYWNYWIAEENYYTERISYES